MSGEFGEVGEILERVGAFLRAMTLAETIGYAGVALSIVGCTMRTMIPLRCFSVFTNLVFITYALLAGVYPTLMAHLILMPLNVLRLVQMMRLVRRVRRASGADLSMDWLKPFMDRRSVAAGTVLFRRGDPADGLYYIVSGRFALRELGVEITAGRVVGELGVLSPDRSRTQTLVCIEPGEVLAISYDELRQLYYQNPEFGFYFLRLTSGRLFENVAALEAEVVRLRAGSVERVA